MTGVLASFLCSSSGHQVFPSLLFSGAAVPVTELSQAVIRVPVSSLLLCLFLCISVASLYDAAAAEQQDDGKSFWTQQQQQEAQTPSSSHHHPPYFLHHQHHHHHPFQSTSKLLIRETTRAWWCCSGEEAVVVHCRLVMSIVVWSLFLLLLLLATTPCPVSGAEEVQHLRLQNCVGDVFDRRDEPLCHGHAIDMAEFFSVDCTSVLFHHPFQEALMVKEALFMPRTTRSRLIIEELEKSSMVETTDSSVVVGGERRRWRDSSNPARQQQPWKLELHENHVIANISMQLEAEVDYFRGWERLDIGHNTQRRRSLHDDALLVPFDSYSAGLDSTHPPPTTHALNFTGDENPHLHHLLLSPDLVCSSSEADDEEEEDRRGAADDESNSTWNLQLETPLLNRGTLSAPTEVHVVPLPSLDLVGGKRNGRDQLVQELAAAEVTDGSPIAAPQEVIFEGFQRRTGTRKYLSAAADLSSSPRQISLMSAQADKPKELDLLDVSAFVLLPVVAVCFWMLTFSLPPSPPPPTRGYCNGAAASKSWNLDHIDPFLGLGLVRNVCNLVCVRALSTIVDSVAASLGFSARLHSNTTHNNTPAVSPPNLPHIRVKLSKSSSATWDSPPKVKSGSGQEKNHHSGSMSNNSKRKATNSGKRIAQAISGVTENYASSHNRACLQTSQQMGGDACSSGSSASVAGSSSPRKGTFMLQKPQLLSHPVQQQHQQPACAMEKEKRRQRKKKGSSSSASSVNHDASSNPGGSSGGSSPFSPASPRTPASLVLPAASPLSSPFEAQSGRGHLGDPIPLPPAAQQPKVATYNKQVTHRNDTVARWSGTGNNSSSVSSNCSSGGTSESALADEGNENKSISSKSKLSIFSHWDRGMTSPPAKQHETTTAARPTLSISASFPAYSGGTRSPAEIEQDLASVVDPASKNSNVTMLAAMPTTTIAPSCRAPGAKITKQSLAAHESRVVVPCNKSNISKFAVADGGGGVVDGLQLEDSNLYDIWGDHFGEVGRFSTQQQNGVAHREKTSGLSNLLVSQNSGSFFSNPVFESTSLETSSSTSEAAGAAHISAIRLMPQQSSFFSVYSEACSLGPISSSSGPVHPLQVAGTGFLQTTQIDRRSVTATITTRKQCLMTDSICDPIAKPWMPAPYKPPMGGVPQHFTAGSSLAQKSCRAAADFGIAAAGGQGDRDKDEEGFAHARHMVE